MNTQLKAPFPYFGGKSRVAHIVWERFGDAAKETIWFSEHCLDPGQRDLFEFAREGALEPWATKAYDEIAKSDELIPMPAQNMGYTAENFAARPKEELEPAGKPE